MFALCLNNPEYFKVLRILRCAEETRHCSRTASSSFEAASQRNFTRAEAREGVRVHRKCQPDNLLLFWEGVSRWITKSQSLFLFLFFFNAASSLFKFQRSFACSGGGGGAAESAFYGSGQKKKIWPRERGSVGERQVEGL